MPPSRCSDPHGIACASQPTRRMKGRKSDVWVCTYCHEIAYPEPAEMATDTDVNNKTAVLLYAFYHSGATVKACAAATGIHPKSVSSSAASLRKEGLMQPPDGSGEMFLTNAGLEATLKLESAKAPTVAEWESDYDKSVRVDSCPAADHQGERDFLDATVTESEAKAPGFAAKVDEALVRRELDRATYADVATEEDGDTVQTSPLDAANAEIARLRAELERYAADATKNMAERNDLKVRLINVTDERDLYKHSHDMAALQHSRLCKAFGLESANPEALEGVICDAINQIRELREANTRLRADFLQSYTLMEQYRKQTDTAYKSVNASTAQTDALRAELAALKSAPTVRLEWGAWDTDSKDVTLTMHVGRFSAPIAEIVIDGHTTARIWYTEAIAGKCVQIQGFNLDETADVLSRNIAAAGLTMPPVPVLPVAK